MKIKSESEMSCHYDMVCSMLDIFTTVVCTKVGKSWCKVGCNTLYKL